MMSKKGDEKSNFEKGLRRPPWGDGWGVESLELLTCFFFMLRFHEAKWVSVCGGQDGFLPILFSKEPVAVSFFPQENIVSFYYSR